MLLKVPKALAEDFDNILKKTNLQFFENIRDLAKQKENKLLSHNELSELFNCETSEEGEKFLEIFRWIVLQAKFSSAEEIIAMLDFRMATTNKWERSRAIILELLKIKSLVTSIVAADLSYEYPNLLTECRVLTDIRPIFMGESAEFIDGAVISQTLKVAYFRDGKRYATTFALDMSDIDDLIGECIRAKKKAETAKNFMQGGGKSALTRITGEESTDD